MSIPLSVITLVASIALFVYAWRKMHGGALLIALLLLPATLYFHNAENNRTILEGWCKEAGITTEDVTRTWWIGSDEGFSRLDVWEIAVQKRYPTLTNLESIETIAGKWMAAYERTH